MTDLQNFLNKMGAKIKGAGSSQIEIEGVKQLKDVSYNIMSDRIEAGTFLCIAAMNHSNIIVKNIDEDHIIPIIDKLEEAGCEIQIEDRQIQIKAPKKLKSVNIKTMPYPGFPTDMQSIFATLLTTAKGSSIIVENIFENRYKYTQELIRMGAKISVEGKTAIIKGVKKLYGANVKATDLRGGAALVMAATTAKGITKVENIDYILRGYERFDKKLEKLGVKIQLKI
ncbi:MAG TPA: UDP-N-acetylglucosamine 1-carboxyvinyltransferase [Clostridiaceae bacterium]|nr:UDP-N-acetylglucosamine 1-carboxyvinyltransferase [Clostridiaceae bacterium]